MELKRIRDLREDNDLTQRQIAEILKIPQAQYWRYEKGYRDFPLDTLLFLAKYYNVSMDYIFGLTDDPSAK